MIKETRHKTTIYCPYCKKGFIVEYKSPRIDDWYVHKKKINGGNVA